MFSKFINFLGKTFKQKVYKEKSISRFEEFINSVEKTDPIYENVKKVADLCDKAIDLSKEKLLTEGKLEIINSEIKEIAYHENLEDKDIEYLGNLIDRYMGFSKDRITMRSQIANFDRSIGKMEKLQEDAKFILANVHDAEKKQRYFKNDLRHLEGEKTALNYERENLLNAQIFIRKFSLFSITFLGICILTMSVLAVFFRLDVFVAMIIISIIMLVLFPSIEYTKRRIKRELIINLKKQKKAVDLFNKKSVVFTHYTKFLNFIYKKYNVENSEKLNKNIKDYEQYKKILVRYDAIGNSLKMVEEQIDFFIKEHGIKHSASTIEAFSKTVDIEDKQRYFKELKKEQERLEKKIKELDEGHNTIWNELILIGEEDKKSDVIDFIIQKYIDEIDKLSGNVKLYEVKEVEIEEKLIENDFLKEEI